MKWILGLPILFAVARIITREQLLEAILQSPEVYRLNNGQMRTEINGSQNRRHRPRTDYDEKLSEPIFCNVTKIGVGYTRFTGPKLHAFFATFKSLYRESKFRAIQQYLSAMASPDLEQLSLVIVEEILGMCALVMPEDDTSTNAKNMISKKRKMLSMVSGENPVFIKAIKNDLALSKMAMNLISAHLFNFLAPHDVDFTVVEPSDIIDIGYSTTKFVYNLLINMASVSDQEMPVFKVIEEYPDLASNLFQLLYLPDARERKCVQIALVNLFNCHPSMRRVLIAMLKFKYLEMSEMYADSFAFIYHDILALHRGFYLICAEEDREGVMARQLQAIFVAQAIPLIALCDLPDFADQWTFLFIEIALAEEEAFELFMEHAFSTKTPRTHYYRDLETINILDNIMTFLELTCAEYQTFIRFIFDKACGMVIRPSMQDDLLEKLFAKKTNIWVGFNVDNGTMMNDDKVYPMCLYEINAGLRRLYLSFIDSGFEIPSTLLSIIDLWQPSCELFEFIAPRDEKHFGVAGKELVQLDLRFLFSRSHMADQDDDQDQ